MHCHRKTYGWIEKEFLHDYDYFGIVEFNDDLVRECIRVIRKHQLKVLDGIQLSSAILSKSKLFIVSDIRLFEAAKKEMPRVEFIG